MAAVHTRPSRLGAVIKAFIAGDATLDAVHTAFQEASPDSGVVCTVDNSAASWARLAQLHDSSFGHAILPLLIVTGMLRGVALRVRWSEARSKC